MTARDYLDAPDPDYASDHTVQRQRDRLTLELWLRAPKLRADMDAPGPTDADAEATGHTGDIFVGLDQQAIAGYLGRDGRWSYMVSIAEATRVKAVDALAASEQGEPISGLGDVLSGMARVAEGLKRERESRPTPQEGTP